MVYASRRHLTERYAVGVDRLLWDTEKRLLPDLEAIALVNAAASERRAETLDIGAALILIQAARLDLDRLERETFEAAYTMGTGDEAIAAVLNLPDAAAAAARKRWLDRRYTLPSAQPPPHQDRHAAASGSPQAQSSRAEAAARASRRASQAAARAAEAAKRTEQLRRLGPAATRPDRAEKAAAHASESRILADEAIERVALGLLRAAEALERSAKATEEVPDACGGDALRQKADEYLNAALRYRRLAGQYRDTRRLPPPRGSTASAPD